jgi:signal transduction histidine kinase
VNPTFWISLVSCVAAAAVASSVAAHSSGARANRLIALILTGSAWWSLCQVLWNTQSDPHQVLWWIKASAPGWMLLGPLALELFGEIEGDGRSRLRRFVPAAYACAAAAIVVYVATPWGLRQAVLTPWGWSYRLGPGFPALYLASVGWLGVALFAWRGLSATAVAHERIETRRTFVAISMAALLSTLTDAVLPFFEIPAPQLGSSAILAMGILVASGVHRRGYFLIAPGAFAPEILAALRDGVALLHPDGRIRSCNEGLGRLVQAAPAELVGARIDRFLPALSGTVEEIDDAELELWPADGEPLPASVSSSLLLGDGGERAGCVLAIRDLREVTALRKRLVTSGRLAAVGELAAGIAHEIANPITFVRANLLELRRDWETIRDAAEKDGAEPGVEQLVREVEELIEESVQGIDRIASIVRNVGAFSHAGRGRPEELDPNELLDNVLGVAALNFSVRVERCYGDLPRILGNPAQLKQAFLNLVLNALQAVGDRGSIRLSTQREGDRVAIRVQDDGPGIPAEAIERVFDPFFTSRPGERLGLGLAQSFQIVRAHGGEISAYSAPGRGAVFEVELPISPPDSERAGDEGD